MLNYKAMPDEKYTREYSIMLNDYESMLLMEEFAEELNAKS